MPTQEELNAAQVELDIANDNYAQMANKYNKFQDVFKLYANATPEVQAKAKDAMAKALDEFNSLRLNMYAAEDRIAQAQNAINTINGQLAATPSTTNYWWQKRRPAVIQPQSNTQATIEQPVVNQSNTYTVPQYTPTQRGVSLQRGIMPEQPLYTTYTPQYRNNTLWGVVKNAAWQISNDWGNAWREWENVVWPRISNFGKNFWSAMYDTYIGNPLRAATAVNNFVFGKPQQRI